MKHVSFSPATDCAALKVLKFASDRECMVIKFCREFQSLGGRAKAKPTLFCAVFQKLSTCYLSKSPCLNQIKFYLLKVKVRVFAHNSFRESKSSLGKNIQHIKLSGYGAPMRCTRKTLKLLFVKIHLSRILLLSLTYKSFRAIFNILAKSGDTDFYMKICLRVSCFKLFLHNWSFCSLYVKKAELKFSPANFHYRVINDQQACFITSC